MNFIEESSILLHKGQIVAIPTETVYGLAGDASNTIALRQIFALKQRPTNHPLIVHIHSVSQAQEWCIWDDRAQSLAEKFWPGPLTLILPKKKHVLDEVTGGHPSIGLRIPNHPVTLELLKTFNGGLAAPSANRFGKISPTTAQHVRDEFGEDIYVLDGGPCSVGVESTIVDLFNGPAVLRPGAISSSAISSLVGPLKPSSTVASGSHKSHYAPFTSLILSDAPEKKAQELREKGYKVAVLEAKSSMEYAQKLYAELRRLDKEGHDILVAQKAHCDHLGDAVNDRLNRASYGTVLKD